VALAKKTKKEKKDSGKLAIRPDHPRRRTESEFACWVASGVWFYISSFIKTNVKKLQFIHKLTASDTSKTAKITKR